VLSASPGGDRPAEDDRDFLSREAEATVVAMREALELARREADDRLQAERAQAAAEADQLRAMITELRQELEAQHQQHADELQRQRQQAADEARQLQATIQAIRDELAQQSG
jgi:predicted RNase H-like nuclease (RuvC/YqgF family)